MTPLASPVGDPGFPKSPGAFDLVVHFFEWKKNIGLKQCIKMCTKISASLNVCCVQEPRYKR